MDAKIVALGHGGQGTTLAQAILQRTYGSVYEVSEIQEKLNLLNKYLDTDLTPEEIQNDVRIYRELWEEKYNELKTDRDYWKAEAIKATAELGEIKIAEEQGLLIRTDCTGCKRNLYSNGDCGICARKAVDMYLQEGVKTDE